MVVHVGAHRDIVAQQLPADISMAKLKPQPFDRSRVRRRGSVVRMRIRVAEESEIERLREMELAAGVAFAEIGMTEVAEAEPPPAETLRAYQQDDRAWVQVDGDELPIGYVLIDVVDQSVHVEQVSVDPSFAGRGLGRELIEHAASWGRDQGFSTITLTTFTEVPWNGPYYERLGFRYLSADELTPELRAIRTEEAALGLDKWPRAAMVRDL